MVPIRTVVDLEAILEDEFGLLGESAQFGMLAHVGRIPDGVGQAPQAIL
jgi:hypothetical protein